jgi:hypothetical protein
MPYSSGYNLTEGLEIVTSNFEALETVFYETKYQDIFWSKSIPAGAINTNLHRGATTSSYIVTDWRGSGGFISDFGGDMPTVQFSKRKVSSPVARASVGAIYTLEDLDTYSYAYGGGLDTELAMIMRKAGEIHVEGVFHYGQSELGFEAYIDHSEVDVNNVINGASTNPEWSTKTAQEIIFDVQDAIRDMWENTKLVHLPDTIELPPSQFALLNDTLLGDTYGHSSVLEYLRKHNLYYTMTGQELTIRPNPHLDGAGVAGADRMIVKQDTAENQKMDFPIPFEMLAPLPEGMKIKVPSQYKFSSIHFRYPKAVAYWDDI